MPSVQPTHQGVKRSSIRRRAPGQPSKQTPERIRQINRALVQAAVTGSPLPSDEELAQATGISERTVFTIRTTILGLNRDEVRRWQQQRLATIQPPAAQPRRELVCATPFAGLWLLVPMIIDSGLAKAAEGLRRIRRTTVKAIQAVLTLLAWSILDFQRLMHLDDFRHWADMGLALFTGRLLLLSDTEMWRWVHQVTPESEMAFYTATAGAVAGHPKSHGRFSTDEHVVLSFTKRKPRPLGKTRVPSRGRSYPAFRLYTLFDLDLGRFVGLLVRRAHQALSQVLLDLLAEIRRLRREAGVREAERVRLIIDRGGYKGSLFQTLMEDPKVSFIAMARATKRNVRQWEAIPESAFRPYRPAGEDNSKLKHAMPWIATWHTQITDCRHPLPSVVIRDDTPATKQRWRVLFHKDEPGSTPSPESLDAEYRRRQHHETGFAQFVHHLAGHSLPKAYSLIRVPNAKGQKRRTLATRVSPRSQLDVHLVGWLKFLSFNLIKDFGAALGPTYAKMHVGTLVRRFISRPGRLYLEGHELVVQLEPFRGADALEPYIQQLNQRRLPIPWLGSLTLRIEVAGRPQGLAATPQLLSLRILANSVSAEAL